MVKHCGACSRDLPLASFQNNSSRADGKQTQCRDCLNRQNSRIGRIRYAAFRQELTAMREAAGGRCAQCGLTKALEFDHIDPTTRRFGVNTKAATRSRESIVAEALKCHLLCRTCHLIKTQDDIATGRVRRGRPAGIEAATGLYARCTGSCGQTKDLCFFSKSGKGHGSKNGRLHCCKQCSEIRSIKRREANKAFITSHKVKCIECGATDALEFDHVIGEKVMAVSCMLSYSRVKICAEIAKCEVVCRQHHIDRTDKRRSNR